MPFTSRRAMIVDLHVTILIKEEHTLPYSSLNPSTYHVFQSWIVPRNFGNKTLSVRPPFPPESEISLLITVGLLRLIKGVMGRPVKKGAPTEARLRDERNGTSSPHNLRNKYSFLLPPPRSPAVVFVKSPLQ